MTKGKNNRKTKIGSVVFLGAKPDFPDVAPELGVIVVKTKKVWQGIDRRFARPDEHPSARNITHPDELVRRFLVTMPAVCGSPDRDPRPQIGYCDVRGLGGGSDYNDVPPNFALPFKDWLGRVFRAHGQSASMRLATVAGCRAQAAVDRTSAEAVWRCAWEHERDHEGPIPQYPEQMVVVPVASSIRKSRLAYRVQSVVR